VSPDEISCRGRDYVLGLRDDAARDRRDRATPGAYDVLMMLLVHLVACLAVSELDSVNVARSLQVTERAEDRRRVGYDTTLSKRLIDLVERPPVPISVSEERSNGMANMARTGHKKDHTPYASYLQNYL
jgi:hypothetical protein